jgi:hypothetical protein
MTTKFKKVSTDVYEGFAGETRVLLMSHKYPCQPVVWIACVSGQEVCRSSKLSWLKEKVEKRFSKV